MHMYIGYPRDGKPLSYYCQRCNVGGYVNNKFFKTFNIHDINLRSDVIRTLMNEIGSNKVSLNRNGSYVRFDNNYDYDQYKDVEDFKEFYKDKIEYLNARFKTDVTKNGFLNTYRIVLSPYDFLKDRMVIKEERDQYNLLNWDENYVGFVSSDGSMITMRLVNNDLKIRRYHVYHIKETTQVQFYSVSNEIDILKPITINMCEGVFDIINLSRIEKFNPPNTLNIAVLGKDYANKLEALIEILGSPFAIKRINIYSDQEVKVNFYKKVLGNVKYLKNKIKLYKSVDTEDYGEMQESFTLKEIKGVF